MTVTDDNGPLKILFVTSELYPFIKVGGLADVSSGLVKALKGLGHDVRVLLPAYAGVKERVGELELGVRLKIQSFDVTPKLWRGWYGDIPLYLLDAPELFDRDGDPYSDISGRDWPDNADRFLLLGQVAARLATTTLPGGWFPDVVHGNDWPCGFAHVLIRLRAGPATVFTIHNLAYQGVTSAEIIQRHNLPTELFDYASMEYHGALSLLKGGLVYADMLTTVSPSYAEEIQTKSSGMGMDGLLTHRKDSLKGILNGIDYCEWDPSSDPNLVSNYESGSLERKSINKRQVLEAFQLPTNGTGPLLAFIGRLVEQKGLGLLTTIGAELARQGARMVILGSGDKRIEKSLVQLKEQYPDYIALRLGYDEVLAHQMEAGADMFLMPSLYEPCGLNQIYSQRYGTIPIVHATGGLRDTVVDTSQQTLQEDKATGFTFDSPTPDAFLDAIHRALFYYRKPDVWKALQQRGMEQDFSWRTSASAYVDVYRDVILPSASAECVSTQ